jgi:hypothetical protein
LEFVSAKPEVDHCRFEVLIKGVVFFGIDGPEVLDCISIRAASPDALTTPAAFAISG